jgi:hypothetical protein
MAPELIINEYNEKVDIFSIGVILYKIYIKKEVIFYYELLKNKENFYQE